MKFILNLKTAEDVVDRIKWDGDLDSCDFTIGYVDRFRGILEKKFDEFSWSLDIADIDYNEDFGVPQHRISYFKWKNILVWNKSTRVDFVFGSAEGKGKNIHEVIAENANYYTNNQEN